MDIRVVILIAAEGMAAIFLLWKLEFLPSTKTLIKCIILISFALFVRLCFFDKENTDYEWFLKVWVEFFRENAGLKGLGSKIGNYNVPYMFFLALFSYSSIRDLYLIKLLSVFFDLILAFSSAVLIRRCGGNTEKQLICFFAVLFLPTVILNSAYWGQCDSIYISLAIMGINFALPDKYGKEHPALSVIFIGMSFAFKLQAVFLMPLWIILWVWRRHKTYWAVLFPLTYVAMMLPAVTEGRTLREVLLFYADQADTVGSALNYNAPSITALMRNVSNQDEMSRLLIIFAFVGMMMLVLAGVLLRKDLTYKQMLMLSVMMSIIIPFFLPHMHDRYFYAADVLSLTLAVFNTALIPAAIGVQFGSLICYIAYINGYYMRLGQTSVYLTNDKGAIAVLASFLWISFFFIRTTMFSEKGKILTKK